MKKISNTSSLVHGCDIISYRLTRFFCPMGLLFKFEPNELGKPKPLPLSVVLIICMTILTSIITDLVVRLDKPGIGSLITEIQTAATSRFVVMVFQFFELYRSIVIVTSIVMPVAQHGPITNVIAQRNKMISEEEQANIASRCFSVYILRTSIWAGTLVCLLFSIDLGFDSWRFYFLCLMMMLLLMLNLTATGPFIYICYLGASLGKHVENFSELHIDTLFDQLVISENHSDMSNGCVERTQNQNTRNQARNSLSERANSLWSRLNNYLGSIIKFLNSNEYPESNEIEMTKTTGNMKISEAARITNTYLIRNRLRKTQVMLSELRDTVNDINKLSTMILMMHVIYDSLIMVIITTASIQSKVYKSLNLLIIPTITHTTCSIISVLYICTCLDETTNQVKLMVNKLFDFIIINLRVQLDESTQPNINRGDDIEQRASIDINTVNDHQHQTLPDNNRFSVIPNVFEKDDEVQSETWCQFQYTRKLAGTIQFTMGGILVVSRRLFLPVLAHILSAVFISIEVMSIIDTLDHKFPTSMQDSNLEHRLASVGNHSSVFVAHMH